jgi:phosphate transport system ATP-binding protein
VRRRIGMVFQKPNPFHKSIYENVAWAPRLHGLLREPELGQLVESSLRRAGLWDDVADRLHQSALGMSGGQQQRLCIARAIALSPEIILMDEPCSALDFAATSVIEDLILELRRDHTIVLATHDVRQAARIADYTGFLWDGELIEFGETHQVFARSREKRTREYVCGARAAGGMMGP